MQTRTYNSLRNSLVALLAQLLSVILSFATRTVFIRVLDIDYLGVNGLFSNVLSILSLAEMGVGTAIIYAMYKPLADRDEKRISALLNLYSKVYKIIGLIVAAAGVALIPFLKYLIKEQPDIPYLTLIYLLFLFNSAISYFFTYKRSIIIASQNAYVSSFNLISFLIIQNILQIVILLGFKEYLLYLTVQILCTLGSNIAISMKADKMFPYLRKYGKETVDSSTKRSIQKNVLAMLSNKIGSVVVSGTDNLLISAFVGVYWVGLFSNYVLITTTVKNFITQMLGGVTASVGNLTATEDNEKAYNVFMKIFFINFVISIYCSIFLLVLINPFIRLWIGDDYLLNSGLVIAIVINFFIIQMRQPAIIFIDTCGLFWFIKWKSLFEAAINLIASLLLLKIFRLGILGVVLGTMTSNVLTNVWWEPLTVYKYKLKRSIVQYFSLYIKDCIFGSVIAIIVVLICNAINFNGFLELSIKAIFCILIPGLFITIIFYRTDEFKYCVNLAKNILQNLVYKFRDSNVNKMN